MRGPFCYTEPMVIQTRLTLEEFLAIPDIDERRLELIDGEVQEKVSPRWGHARLAATIIKLLDGYGFSGPEARAVIRGHGDRADSSPLPDVAFYRTDPPEQDEWMARPPHVAVEILSPGQSRIEMRAKADLYIAFGVESVWVIDPERESIEVYEKGTRRILTGSDRLETPAVPGLSTTVREVFDAAARRS